MSEIKSHQIADPESLDILTSQIQEGTIIKRMYVGVQINADDNIDLPTGFDTETNKFLVYINGDIMFCSATDLGADTIYKGDLSSQIKSSSNITAGSIITLVKIPGLATGSVLFTNTVTGNTWV